MVTPVIQRLLLSDLLDLRRQRHRGIRKESVLQSQLDAGQRVSGDLPGTDIDGVLPGACLRDIENIPQAQGTLIKLQQSDALVAAVDIAMHGIVPQIVFGAGGGIGPLRVDQQLILVVVFVEPCRSGEERRPFTVISRDLPGSFICQLGIGLYFCGHVFTPHNGRFEC